MSLVRVCLDVRDLHSMIQYLVTYLNIRFYIRARMYRHATSSQEEQQFQNRPSSPCTMNVAFSIPLSADVAAFPQTSFSFVFPAVLQPYHRIAFPCFAAPTYPESMDQRHTNLLCTSRSGQQ